MPFFFLGSSSTSTATTTFVELYGEDLDRELGTTDRTQRFTTARRKAAINDAQMEFIERTECLSGEFTVSVVDGTAEYDLESGVVNIIRVGKGGPSLKRVDATATIYIEGPDDFPQTNPPLLTRLTPGWRSLEAGTPGGWYLRRDGGSLYFGLTPPPDIPSGETWSLLVPCVVRATDMVNDTDKPFTISGGTSPGTLTPWHPALVHYAAYLLEKYRKDPQRSGVQVQLFDSYVQRYLKQDRPKGGQMIQLATNYRKNARSGGFRRMSVDGDHVVD